MEHIIIRLLFANKISQDVVADADAVVVVASWCWRRWLIIDCEPEDVCLIKASTCLVWAAACNQRRRRKMNVSS